MYVAADHMEELALIELSRLQRAAMAYVPRKKQPVRQD